MPLITITRGSLCAARQLAERICAELGCTMVTREQVVECARAYGIEETGMAGAGFMEKKPPQFWDRQAPERRLYLIYIRACLMEYLTSGQIVYVGHLAQFMLNNVPRILRLRVDASLPLRIQTVMDTVGLSEAQAREHIAEIDDRRKRWARFLYDVDYDSPLNYDIILNRERISMDSLISLVSCAVRSPEFTIDEQTLNEIRNARLAAVVTAYLARDIRTRGMELAVDANNVTGAVTVKGVSTLVGAATWEQDIKRVTLEAPGVNSVDVVDAR